MYRKKKKFFRNKVERYENISLFKVDIFSLNQFVVVAWVYHTKVLALCLDTKMFDGWIKLLKVLYLLFLVY